MKNPRFTALKTLQKVAHGEFIQDAFDRKGLNPKDERLAETIINGTIQHELFLDYVIDQFVSNTDKLQANLRILLRNEYLSDSLSRSGSQSSHSG